jgi:hypothetical protein
MLRLLIDENFDRRILRGIRLRVPHLDYVIAQDTELKGLKDQALLAWAAQEQRVILTHDVNTVPGYAYERIASGLPMPGVIVVPEDLAIRLAIEEAVTLIECSTTDELDSQVKYIPIQQARHKPSVTAQERQTHTFLLRPAQ